MTLKLLLLSDLNSVKWSPNTNKDDGRPGPSPGRRGGGHLPRHPRQVPGVRQRGGGGLPRPRQRRVGGQQELGHRFLQPAHFVAGL